MVFSGMRAGEGPVVIHVEVANPEFFQRLAELDKGMFSGLDKGLKLL
jgi:hypothetical protein